ncbi:hypothetical protein TELCIR_03403 [Teladorsagia circumcincta]|uniref:DH domain-containing protein n=1 Tax=Teladorsagia circumcincta TaxID=45464 RepID=A0A2G9UWH0_TELCI|nr:hypothetical protein TELCIR_03403 [Teladorsagia circumcincta]
MEEATIKQIFGKIKPMVDVHEKIVAQLEDLLENFDRKGHRIAEVWKNISYELIQIYPAYTNYCDSARSMFVDACEKSSKLKLFIETLEKQPEFRRQRVADIMTIPVQRLAGVKLLLEKLQKKSKGGQSAAIQKAIDKVGDVLSQSNTVRLNSDKYMPTLALMAEIEEIPASLVGASNMMIRTVKGRLVCASNKISIKDDREIYVILLRDATVMERRRLNMNGKMTFAEIPVECQATLKKELHENGYSTEQKEEEAKISKLSSLAGHTLRWGTVSEVFTTRTTVVRSTNQQTGQLELQKHPDISTHVGQRESTGISPQVVYPVEEAG